MRTRSEYYNPHLQPSPFGYSSQPLTLQPFTLQPFTLQPLTLQQFTLHSISHSPTTHSPTTHSPATHSPTNQSLSNHSLLQAPAAAMEGGEAVTATIVMATGGDDVNLSVAMETNPPGESLYLQIRFAIYLTIAGVGITGEHSVCVALLVCCV